MANHKRTSGFLLLDKAPGISSFQAIRPIKRFFKGERVGFAGTLDPDATGLLIVAVGWATRLISTIQVLPKTYQFKVIPGICTDTYDLSGNVISTQENFDITRDMVEHELKAFLGNIDQVPPAYSALKINGKRACDRARAGEDVKLASRKLFVHSLELTTWEIKAWSMELKCSKGTYVRSIAHDLGQRLGCGAVASEIRRTAIGGFNLENAITCQDIDTPPVLLSMEAFSNHLPTICVMADAVRALANGRKLDKSVFISKNGPPDPQSELVRAVDEQGRFLALGCISPEMDFLPKKVFLDYAEAC